MKYFEIRTTLRTPESEIIQKIITLGVGKSYLVLRKKSVVHQLFTKLQLNVLSKKSFENCISIYVKLSAYFHAYKACNPYKSISCISFLFLV